MKKKGRHSVVTTAIIVIIAVSLVAGWSLHSIPGYHVEPGNHVAEKAFYDHHSDLMVEVSGEVVRILGKEGDDKRLQWFQMRTPEGQYLLVGHDNGLANPIPLSARDSVIVRGIYQWTESGGTIRGTHKDNTLARRHGWVEHKGKKYQ